MQDRPIESDISPAIDVQTWSYLTLLGGQIQDGFAQIPIEYYPNNPAKEGFFPTGTTGYEKFFTENILPLLPLLSLLVSWKNTWSATLRLSEAENINYDNTLEVVVAFLTATATSAFWYMIAFGSVEATVFLAPYFLLGAVGLAAVYAAYNIIKYICDAAEAKNDEDYSKITWEIWKQFLGLAVNTLGFVSTIIFGLNLGPQLTNAVNMAQEAITHWDFDKLTAALILVEGAGNTFRAVKTLYYTFSGFLALNLLTSIWELNLDTLKTLQDPSRVWGETQMRFGTLKKGLEALPDYLAPFGYLLALPVMTIYVAAITLSVALRTASICLYPLQYIFTPNETPELAEEVKVAPKEEDQEKDFQAIHAVIQQKLVVLEEQNRARPSPARADKIAFLTRYKNEKLGDSLASYNVEKSAATFAKEAGPNTWQSFFHRKGHVQRIRDEHLFEYEKKWYPQLANK